MRGLLAIGVLAALAGTARAEVATDDTREVHGVAIATGGAVYLGVEFLAKPYIVPEHCRICEPPAVDAAVSDALRWRESPVLANVLSTFYGYAVAPIYAIAMTSAESSAWRTRYDDAVPILEASIAVGLLHHFVKFTVGRQRPFVHHAAPGRAPDDDDNASLFSGHTGLAFACATAGGVVAHERHYADAPWIFAGGYAIAVATGYLRIAADKHWFTDVLIGAVVGVGLGVAIPLGLHGDTLRNPTRATVAATPRDTPRILAVSIPF